MGTILAVFGVILLVGGVVGFFLYRRSVGAARQWEERRLLLLSSQAKPVPDNAAWIETMSQEGDRFWADGNLVEASILILMALKRIPQAGQLHAKARTRYSQEEWHKDQEVDLVVAAGSVLEPDVAKL